jgi:hypothetical protein
MPSTLIGIGLTVVLIIVAFWLERRWRSRDGLIMSEGWSRTQMRQHMSEQRRRSGLLPR